MMRALHLDLVALRSSDLAGDSAGVRRIGEQVREVSRGVEALASAADELFLDDLGRLGAGSDAPERIAPVQQASSPRGHRPRPRQRS
jgi:hypothetical protein